jgi:hypothetical protein
MPRMTIEFPKQVDDVLKKLAQEDETTKADVIRRALAIYNYLKDAGVKTGGDLKVSITDKDDNIIKDIVF